MGKHFARNTAFRARHQVFRETRSLKCHDGVLQRKMRMDKANLNIKTHGQNHA